MAGGTIPQRPQGPQEQERRRGGVDPADVDTLIRELLGPQGLGAEAFIKDVLQAILVGPVSIRVEDPERQALICKALSDRLRLDEGRVAEVVRLVYSPQNRMRLGPEEIAAFEARFGSAALKNLEVPEERKESRTLESSDALFLLDLMMALVKGPGGIEAASVSQLRNAADQLGIDEYHLASMLWRHDHRHASGDRTYELKGNTITIGRSAECDIRLDDPGVANRHAHLIRVDNGWQVYDLGSGRLTVRDNEAFTQGPLLPGQKLGIGPYTLWLTEEGRSISVGSTGDLFTLTVRNLVRTLKNGGIRLLSDVSFTVRSKEVVALVGPSGCGKTTLINALCGIAPADSGEVLLDGVDFHELLAHDRSIVGIVPQDDLVYPQLTVEESLDLAARLRFPQDVTRAEIQKTVSKTLEKLNLARVKDRAIGDAQQRGISGGQRKRVNLGQELLTSSTRILFLDEPTSGLDPQTAQDIVSVVRTLAYEGRIVFLVTHDLSPAVLSKVDHLLVMAREGHLVYFGPPAQAAKFFGVPSADAIFAVLDGKNPVEWAAAYKEDAAFRKYITMREHLVQTTERQREKTGEYKLRLRRRSLFKDLVTQTRRYRLVKARDRLGMVVLVAQPLLLATAMLIAFPVATPPAIFMLALSSLWFGMSASVRELIADRPIWRRERRVGARLLPYLGSKVLVLGAIVVFQVALITGIIAAFLGLGGMGFSLPLLFLTQALTGLMGMALGLVVSASFNSSEAAVGMLPLTLVPQIVFSSIMVPIRGMGALAKVITWGIPFRYSFEASLKAGDKLREWAPHLSYPWELLSMDGHMYNLGFKLTSDVNDNGLPLSVLCGALGGFVTAFLVAAGLITLYRDRQTG